MLVFHFAQLLENQQGTVNGDSPEALHEMRVAAARLRAALRDFRKAFPTGDLERLTDDVRWLSNLLGRLRDLDVFIAWLRDYAQHAPEPQRGLIARLIQEREAARARERAALLAGLHSPRYQRLQQDFNHLIQSQPNRNRKGALVEQARAKIERERQRVRKAKKGADAKHLTRLHHLRIEFKRLRYTAEFFASLYPDHLQRLIKPSRKIQDELGSVHDASEYILFLQDAGKTQSSEPGMRSTLDRMMGALKQQEAQQYKAFRKSYKKYNSSKFRRKIEKELDTE